PCGATTPRRTPSRTHGASTQSSPTSYGGIPISGSGCTSAGGRAHPASRRSTDGLRLASRRASTVRIAIDASEGREEESRGFAASSEAAAALREAQDSQSRSEDEAPSADRP